MDEILKSMKLDTWLKAIKLDKGNIRHQSMRTSLTYNHIWSIYKHFQECDLIFMEKVGREYKIRLTEKGERLKKLFDEIENVLGDAHGRAKKIREIQYKKDD